jgi:hypothetical protein
MKEEKKDDGNIFGHSKLERYRRAETMGSNQRSYNKSKDILHGKRNKF